MRDPIDIKNIYGKLAYYSGLSCKFTDVLLLQLPRHINAAILGLSILPILKYYNVKVGEEGYEYYGEVHKSKFNCYIHTLGMPFTIYGITQWLPTLFFTSPKKCIYFIRNLFYMYLTHYLSVDWKIAAMYSVIYAPVAILSAMHHYYGTMNDRFKRGILISTIALLFQEGVGHWYGGDKQSRPEAVPNAILYAKYYSLHHLIYK